MGIRATYFWYDQVNFGGRASPNFLVQLSWALYNEAIVQAILKISKLLFRDKFLFVVTLSLPGLTNFT
jgi:hypothetical protein